MRFSVDAWDPSYGAATDTHELVESTAKVDTTLEVSSAEWSPIPPRLDVALPGTVLFVDGVRRIDARAWIDDVDAADGEGRRSVPGLCASYAAGVVCAAVRNAQVIAATVRRGLFTDARSATTIATRAGTYQFHRTAMKPGQQSAATLSYALQRSLAALELEMAIEARQQRAQAFPDEDDLLIVDGPLRGKAHLSDVLGYIKTHAVQYLPPAMNAVVADLGTGYRTPVFLVADDWERHSWYLRLPCAPMSPWAGIVRLEAPRDLNLPDVVEVANMTQSLLGCFASVEYKDGRAPQNLTPIGGLEKELRHRLGLAPLLYRELRSAAWLGAEVSGS